MVYFRKSVVASPTCGYIVRVFDMKKCTIEVDGVVIRYMRASFLKIN